MQAIYGEHAGTLLMLHGGAGPQDPKKNAFQAAQTALLKIGRQVSKSLAEGMPLGRAAALCLEQLELEPLFNAGVGSALQSDGVARLSASVMDGRAQRFSGVMSVPYVAHPSRLAQGLQKRRARVLTQPGVELLAREMKLPVHGNLTEKRSRQWLKTLGAYDYTIDGVDTVGCVIRSKNGGLIAASSTGGRGFEFPGRVSDTATVAGNYASRFAAIAATGIGEEIVDDAVAARIETRVRDGLTLHAACRKTYAEARRRKRQYGWIAATGAAWAVAHTTPGMPFVVLQEGKVVCVPGDC